MHVIQVTKSCHFEGLSLCIKKLCCWRKNIIRISEVLPDFMQINFILILVQLAKML